MSTEVAVIDAEVVGDAEPPEPLSEGKAKVLDRRIRQAEARFTDEGANLMGLIEEALKGQIHIGLGYSSFGAWAKETISISPTDDTKRKALVSMMSGQGFSQRIQAGILGVNQSTISRDADASSTSPDSTSVTVDNKTYKKPKKEPKPEPLDVEVVEEEVKQQPISQEFRNERYELTNSVSSFQDLVKDERFPKARKTIAKNNLPQMQAAISELQLVVDALMEA